MGFPLKTIHFGVPPFMETPILGTAKRQSCEGWMGYSDRFFSGWSCNGCWILCSILLGYDSAGVGKCPNWTSPNYWEYNIQQIFEGDVQNPQKGTFTNPCSASYEAFSSPNIMVKSNQLCFIKEKPIHWNTMDHYGIFFVHYAEQRYQCTLCWSKPGVFSHQFDPLRRRTSKFTTIAQFRTSKPP